MGYGQGNVPETTTTIGALLNGASAKTVPVDADLFAIADSTASFLLKNITYVNLKTAIIAAIVDSAPSTLDTLNELAAALGDDPNFATTVTNALAAKAIGAASSTDNTIPRFDGTGGKQLQTSGVTIDDANSISTSGNVNVGNVAGIPAIYSPSVGAYQAIWDTVTNGVTRLRDNGADNGACLATKPYVAAQITSNQNNYDPGGRSRFIELSSDAARDITGFGLAGGNMTGEAHFLVNVGAQNIVLKHQDTNSTDVNRLINTTGADITLSANQMAFIYYSGAATRWRVSKMN